MEGIYFLPDKKTYDIKFSVNNLLQLYPNAFGRVTLRPATLKEVIRLERPQKNATQVKIVNNGYKTEKVLLEIISSDYFGVVSDKKEVDITLGAKESRAIPIRLPDNRWKTVFTIKQGAKSSLSYYDFPHEGTWYTCRSEMKKLRAGWQSVPGDSMKASESAPVDGWEKADFPITLKSKYKSHFMWVKNKITIPKEWHGKEIYLYFPDVRYKADIFINDTQLGSLYRWETPAKLNLGKLAKPGETVELRIRLTDYIVGLRPGSPIPSAELAARDPQGGFIAPIAHLRSKKAILSLETAPELIAEPAIRVEHAFIKTFVSKEKRIEVEAEFVNNTDKASEVVLSTEILHAGNKVLDLPKVKLTLPSGKITAFTLKKSWVSPVLWTPDNPFLYEMRFTLRSNAGDILDIRRERFGMREVKVVGTRFLLNGKPYKPYGFSVTQPFGNLWPHQPLAYQFYRHNRGSGDLHIPWKTSRSVTNIQLGDELGICAISLNDYGEFHRRRYDRSDDRIWQLLFQEQRQVFRAMCNNPSVVMWCVGGEDYLGQKGAAEKMGELFEKVTQLDPTRPVSTTGPTHMPVGPAVKTTTPHGWGWADRRTYFLLHPEERPAYMKEKGVFNYIPNGEESGKWSMAKTMTRSEIAKKFVKNQKPLRHLDSRAVIFGECMYMHASMVPGLTGESLYFPLFNWYSHINHAAARKYMVRMTRHAEPAAFSGHVASMMTKDLSPVCAYTADQKLRFRSGEEMILTFDVFNAHYFDNVLDVKLTLRLDGKDVAVKTKNIKMGVCEKKIVTFNFGTFDAKNRDLRFDLLVNVESAHGAVFNEWEEVFVYQKPDFSLPTTTKLSVYDPSGVLKNFLEARKVPFTALKTCEEWIPGENSLFLIAPNSLYNNDMARKLGAKLKTGGRVIVLDHDALPDLTSLELSLANEETNTFTYPINRPDSPFYRKIMPEDLRFWTTLDNDLLVARKMIRLPVKGNFRIYASGNYTDGVKACSTPLLEVGVGKGSVIYSQLNLSRALETEPVAERILALMLTAPVTREMNECGVIMPPLKLALVRGKTGLMAKEVKNEADDLDSLKVLLIDADSLKNITGRFQNRINEWCLNGGDILIQDIKKRARKRAVPLSWGKIAHKAFSFRPGSLYRE